MMQPREAIVVGQGGHPVLDFDPIMVRSNDDPRLTTLITQAMAYAAEFDVPVHVVWLDDRTPVRLLLDR
jgi:hypothetical protein